MSAYVQERYKPVQIGVNATVSTPSNALGGFLCVTAGTISIVTNTTTPRTILPTFTVTAGIYYPLPFHTSLEGATITAAGGASGVLGVA